MSFFDDSHILSRLGILDSTEESPRREKDSPTLSKKKKGSGEKELFVEVNINGEAETDSDNEDTLFDKDALLSSGSKSKVLRRNPESFRCRYLLLMLTYFSLGAVCHSSMTLSMHKNSAESHLIRVYQCLGTLIGVLLGRSAIFRLHSTLFFLVNMLTTTFVFLLLGTLPDSMNSAFISTIQRIVVGALSYASLSLYFSLWRGHTRKPLWLFALFALGLATSIYFAPAPSEEIRGIVKREIQKEIQPIPPMNMDTNSSEERAQRPDAAVGMIKQVSKTEVNEKMRENQNVESSNSTEMGEQTESTSRRTKSTTPLPTTATTKTLITSTRPGRNKDRFRLAVPDKSTSVEIFVLITVITTTVFHILAFVCCCTNCRLGVDPKILKLRDPSQGGFTRGCFLRLTAFYFIIGFLENFLQMYLFTENINRPSLTPMTSFVVLLIAIIPGAAAFSTPVVFLIFVSAFISAIGVGLDSGFNLNLAVLCGSLGYLPICVLLNIETRVQPRPILLLDYFFIPQTIGHLLAAIICWIQEKPWYTELIVFSVILMSFIGISLMMSVAKAVRLKKIMEYTSSTPQGTLGEYLALVDRENLSLSDIDEQSDSQEM